MTEGKPSRGDPVLSRRIALGFVLGVVTLSLAVGIAGARKRHLKGARGPERRATALEVFAGGACASFGDGTKSCWGDPERGAPPAFACTVVADLGTVTCVPKVEGLRSVVRAEAVASGARHACVLAAGGEVTCFGDNSHGQCGVGGEPSFPASVLPTRLHVDPLRSLAAGGATSCGVAFDGMVRCWGGNADGELVTGDRRDRETPQTISGLFNVSEVGVGEGFICARLEEDGSVWCWGRNDRGQLGDGTREARSVPVRLRL